MKQIGTNFPAYRRFNKHTSMKLKQSTIQTIRTNKPLKKALLEYYQVTPSTFYRWLEKNDHCLTVFASLKIIAGFTGIEETEDLVDQIL
jgi:hypothetical protein